MHNRQRACADPTVLSGADMTTPQFKLSICIGTYNRAAFIGETLESIISQATSDLEIVVSDNASTDNTEEIVAKYGCRFGGLRYIRQPTNIGLDRNFDHAVDQARGEYCWLFTDDDVVKPHAIARILEALRGDFSLVLVNVESRDLSMSKVLQHRWIDIDSDRVYGREEMDRLFLDMDDATRAYIGKTILKREIWLARDRQQFYGSLYIHVGTIFQERLPGETLVIAEPLVSYRLGNENTYSSKIIELMFSKWPSLVESLSLTEGAKRSVASAEPWGNPSWLLFLRGWGLYSLAEYRRWVRPRLSSTFEKLICILVALLPGALVNFLFLCYYSVRRDRGHLLHLMGQSRFNLRNLRIFNAAPNALDECKPSPSVSSGQPE